MTEEIYLHKVFLFVHRIMRPKSQERIAQQNCFSSIVLSVLLSIVKMYNEVHNSMKKGDNLINLFESLPS